MADKCQSLSLFEPRTEEHRAAEDELLAAYNLGKCFLVNRNFSCLTWTNYAKLEMRKFYRKHNITCTAHRPWCDARGWDYTTVVYYANADIGRERAFSALGSPKLREFQLFMTPNEEIDTVKSPDWHFDTERVDRILLTMYSNLMPVDPPTATDVEEFRS